MDMLTTSNRVKQGAIISPILFCVRIYVLLLQLERSKFGCYIGSRFCGSFGYADDMCIIAQVARPHSQCSTFVKKLRLNMM